MLQPFLKKLIYDPDTETILDDPSLFFKYLYEASLSIILGAVSGSVNVATDTDASVQTDSEYDILTNKDKNKTDDKPQKILTARERLAILGEYLLDKGGMPSPEQLSAMGMDAPTARGIQSLVWLATEGDPPARRKVEAMIDLTAPEAQEDKTVHQKTVDGVVLSEEKSSKNDSATRLLNNGHSIYDMAKIYAEKVRSNSVWKWRTSFPNARKLSKADKEAIKSFAIEAGLIPNVPINKISDTNGKVYWYADFDAVGSVKKRVRLPEQLYFKSDKTQFKWLDNEIGGRPNGYTWHHSEVDGQMELVPTGIHNVFFHHGGRTQNHWAYRRGGR